MKHLAPVVVLFSFALWMGGLVATLLFVQSLFANDRASAVLVAPLLFHTFEPFAVGCALVCFWMTVLWAIQSRSRHVLLMLIFLGVALSLLLVSYGVITPRVESTRGTDAFQSWHRASNVVYLAQMFMVIMAGLALPGAIRSTMLPLLRRTNAAAAPGSALPVEADRPAT